MQRAKIEKFGLQSGSDRTMYVQWAWDKTQTEHYEVRWCYRTPDNIVLLGNESTTEMKTATYTAPDEATVVSVQIRPVARKHKVNGKEMAYWSAPWCPASTYYFKNNPPATPAVPEVTLEELKLTAVLSNIEEDSGGLPDTIVFEVWEDNSTLYKSSKTTVRSKTDYARYSCYVQAGREYTVRCRAVRNGLYSEYTKFSNPVATQPAPCYIKTIRAESETSVYLEFVKNTANSKYDIEYATEMSYFDSSNATTIIDEIETDKYIVTGLESGDVYYFRVRATNKNGSSAWSAIRSVVIGETPDAPTTWSSSTVVTVGETLKLYWTHNAKDNSNQTKAEIELCINDVKETHTILDTEDPDTDENTFEIGTSAYSEGVQIQWRVRTAGVTNEYGDWSVQRTVDIYAEPTLTARVVDTSNNLITTLTSFPFRMNAVAGPASQYPIGYHVSITADESYQTVDAVGNAKFVNVGDSVYSKYFDISDELTVEFTPGDVDLETDIEYTLTCVVTMNSGLTATDTSKFTVALEDTDYEPNAEIGIDFDTYSATIMPYCSDIDGDLVDDVTLSVYRREYDGSFTELMTGVENNSTYITDPHPALDYARYRIIAKSKTTGAISYYDPPGYPVNGKAVIIQWDEAWREFDSSVSDYEDVLEQSNWGGSMLKLAYNIDVSDSNSSDVALVEYIGRSHPVSYYGTQLGVSSTWNVEIDKSDKETLYALRRLARWMGDVYVREPSGSGYWANIAVSFNQKHRKVTIPVTFDITRVEGGV